jgi:hypothetical protein
MDVLIEIGEQLLHAIWAFAPIAFFWLISRRPKWGWREVVGGAIVGLVIALPRELVDQWPIERPWDTVLDLSFFMIGGALAGLMGWLVKKK